MQQPRSRPNSEGDQHELKCAPRALLLVLLPLFNLICVLGSEDELPETPIQELIHGSSTDQTLSFKLLQRGDVLGICPSVKGQLIEDHSFSGTQARPEYVIIIVCTIQHVAFNPLACYWVRLLKVLENARADPT